MATHTQTRFIVAIADLERFEIVNKTLGREGGDELLRLAATRFAAAAGGSDVVAHVGSDKFAVIIPESSEAFDAARLLEEFWRQLARDAVQHR